jgi:hypothetical protein
VSQEPERASRHHGPILEPEVQEVADDEEPAAGRGDVVQEAYEFGDRDLLGLWVCTEVQI